MSLRVVATGPRALIQDLGRSGYAGLGVSPSGAADRGAHRLANRLVGNPEEAATIEVLLGGLVVEAVEPTLVAVTGAPAPLTVDGSGAAQACPLYLAAGARLALGAPVAGLRSYVAILGGVHAERVLGSRSTDTISGLGPRPLSPGDLLTADAALTSGEAAAHGLATGVAADVASSAYRGPSGPEPAEVRLAGTWGPRADWFTPQARAALMQAAWEVGPDSDRVGVRCRGPVLRRAVDGELASEPTVRGSIQVPPSGQPVVFLADHPTTGGYPVIAVLDAPSVDLVAQLRPGDVCRIDVGAPAYDSDLELPPAHREPEIP